MGIALMFAVAIGLVTGGCVTAVLGPLGLMLAFGARRWPGRRWAAFFGVSLLAIFVLAPLAVSGPWVPAFNLPSGRPAPTFFECAVIVTGGLSAAPGLAMLIGGVAAVAAGLAGSRSDAGGPRPAKPSRYDQTIPAGDPWTRRPAS